MWYNNGVSTLIDSLYNSLTCCIVDRFLCRESAFSIALLVWIYMQIAVVRYILLSQRTIVVIDFRHIGTKYQAFMLIKNKSPKF